MDHRGYEGENRFLVKEGDVHMFMGEYSHTIDAKGRMIIPSKFREKLGEEFVLTKGLDGCLSIYPTDEWKNFEEKLKALPLNDKNARAFLRFFVASATMCLISQERKMEFKHQSVLLEETIRNLRVKPDGTYVDGTLGGGGHSYRICQQLSAKGSLIGIDQDEAAIKAAGERLKDFKENVTIIRSNYCNMKMELQKIGITSVDGIILDLGVSSYQLDNKDRGFTYREDVPLDMRMDQRNPRTARDIVNTYSEKDLYRIIRDYGEDKFAKNIAKHICLSRKEKPIETTGELAEIIKHAIPMKMRAVGGHPAKRTFQAIRIELNQELEVLRDSLDDMIGLLNDGGRICIITFHSLEDRIVKTIFRRNENPCTCPPDFPVCVCGKKSKGKVITRKPILPSEEELQNNSRSKSAKLRVFERVTG